MGYLDHRVLFMPVIFGKVRQARDETFHAAGESKTFHQLGTPAQPLAKQVDDGAVQPGTPVKKIQEFLPFDGNQYCIFFSIGAMGSFLQVEDGDFAEDVARVKDLQDNFLAVIRCRGDGDAAGLDCIKVGSFIALQEYAAFFSVVRFFPEAQKKTPVLFGHGSEDAVVTIEYHCFIK